MINETKQGKIMKRCATCGSPTPEPYKVDEYGNIYDFEGCYKIRACQEFCDRKGGSGVPIKLPGIGRVEAPINNSRKQPIYPDDYKANIGRSIDGELWHKNERDK